MNFIIENKKDLTIFRIQEKRLDASLAPELKSQILMLVAEGKKYLIIDLAQVDTIDSSGIGALLIAHRHTAEHEGFAAFIGVHGNVKDLLQMMQLHKQLYIFSSVQEVLRNLEEVEETEEVKTKTVEEEEEEDIDPLPELDEVDLSAESDLALSEEQLDEASLDVSEFPDETAAEFSEAEEEKEELTPKKPAKTKKSAKVSKPSKASKPAKAKSAKAKSATAKKKSSLKAKSATAKKKSSPKAKSATAKKKSSSTVKSKKK
jgi:anti-sigma B factor antagonist